MKAPKSGQITGRRWWRWKHTHKMKQHVANTKIRRTPSRWRSQIQEMLDAEIQETRMLIKGVKAGTGWKQILHLQWQSRQPLEDSEKKNLGHLKLNHSQQDNIDWACLHLLDLVLVRMTLVYKQILAGSTTITVKKERWSNLCEALQVKCRLENRGKDVEKITRKLVCEHLAWMVALPVIPPGCILLINHHFPLDITGILLCYFLRTWCIKPIL